MMSLMFLYFFYDLIGLENNDPGQFVQLAGLRLESMKVDIRKHMFTKRVVKRIRLFITNGMPIDLNTCALICPTVPGAIMWLGSVTNRQIKEVVGSTCIFIALHRSMLQLKRLVFYNLFLLFGRSFVIASMQP